MVVRMVQKAACFNTSDGAVLIMKDIGHDGKADTPELAEFLRNAGIVASEALR